MTLKTTLLAVAAALIVGVCAGVALVWQAANPKPAKWAMTSAPSVRLRDGALLAERRYDPEAKPKQALPAGSRAERLLSAVVMPRTSGPGPEGKEAPAGVTVDLTLTQEKDGSRRAAWSSPDGTVIEGTDTWVIPPAEPRIVKHQVLTAYNPFNKDGVLAYTHRIGSIGPVTFRAGPMVVYQNREHGEYVVLTAEW